MGAYHDKLLCQRVTGYSAERRFNDCRLGQLEACLHAFPWAPDHFVAVLP